MFAGASVSAPPVDAFSAAEFVVRIVGRMTDPERRALREDLEKLLEAGRAARHALAELHEREQAMSHREQQVTAQEQALVKRERRLPKRRGCWRRKPNVWINKRQR
jgi:hypothetical protein